jgi:hypothetical protein
LSRKRRRRRRSFEWFGYWWEHRLAVYLGRDRLYLIRFTPNGFPIDCGELGTHGCDGRELRAIVDLGVSAMLEKKADRKVAGQEQACAPDPRALKECPTVWAYLTQTTWSDGTRRETSSVLMFQQDGMIKAMLRDADAGLCLWVAARSFYGAFSALEAALNDPNAEWRVDRRAEGQQARRVKKAA